MNRPLRATVVATTLALAAAGTTVLSAPTTASSPPVLTTSAALMPGDAAASAVGPDGTTYVVGTALKAGPLEHNGEGKSYEGYVLAYAPDGTLRDSRYLGGTGFDEINAVSTTPDGSVVVAGSTISTDFPTTSGTAGTGYRDNSDAFVAVLSSDLSTITAATIYGGSGNETATGVAVDGTGTIWVTGVASSPTLPVTAGSAMSLGAKDGLVLGFGPGLTTLPVAQRLGGNAHDGVNGVVGLPDGGAVVVGTTTSGVDFPGVGAGIGGSNGPLGAIDAYAAHIRPNGTLAWSTRFGTADSDEANSVTLDQVGRPVIAGSTRASDFPATSHHGPDEAGSGRAFVTTLAATGDAIVQSTVVAAAGGDLIATDVAVDPWGGLYLAATSTAMTTVPLVHAISTSGGEHDQYAVKLTPDGSQIAWASRLGTGVNEHASGIVVDPAGTVTIVGSTANKAYPDAAPSPATAFFNAGLMHRIRSTPHVTSFTGPATTTSPTPTFAITVDVTGARTECRVDDGTWSSCEPASYTTPPLAPGTHTIEARATDFPGVHGPTASASVTILPAPDTTPTDTTHTSPTPPATDTTAPDPTSLTTDTTAPQTTIAKHPRKRTTKAKARFVLASSEAGSTFACRLDKRPWKTCGPTYAVKVKPGKHRLQVRATDAAGNTDPTPAVFRWHRI